MKVPEECKVLCEMHYQEKEIERIIKRIRDDYYVLHDHGQYACYYAIQ